MFKIHWQLTHITPYHMFGTYAESQVNSHTVITILSIHLITCSRPVRNVLLHLQKALFDRGPPRNMALCDANLYRIPHRVMNV